MEKTQVKVEFIVLSKDMTELQLTQRIGSIPMQSGDKGQLLKSGKRREYSHWEICTDYEDSMDINDQIDKIIPQIEKSMTNITEIIKSGQGEVRLCIVIIIENGQTPAMTIKRELIALLKELDGEIEFDTYANPYLSQV